MDIKKQVLVNTCGNTVYLAALWLLTVITTQIFGYEGIGTLTLAMAIGNTVAMIQLYGVRSYQSSDVEFHHSSKDYLFARCLTAVAGCLVGAAICLMMEYPYEKSLAIVLFILVKTSETFSDVLFGNDQRAGHLEFAGYSMAVRGVLLVGLFWGISALFQNLNTALWVTAFGMFALSLGLDLPVHNHTVKGIYSIDHGVWGILIDCFPLFIATLIPVIITAFPRIVLERYFGGEILGLYGNVSTPALLLTTVIPTILTALLPTYGKAFQNRDYQSIRSIWLKSLAGTAMITFVCIVGAVLFGRPVLTFVYTEEISPYVNYLYSILVAMMLYTMTMCNNTTLISMRRNWGVMMTSFIPLLVCLGTSLPLIRSLGVNGAISVLVISYGLQTTIQAMWIMRICNT